VTIPTVKLIWNEAQKRFDDPDDRIGGERFVQLGRVPQRWLEEASALPGKALEVGISIWGLALAVKKTTVMVTPDNVKGFGVDASAKTRALTALADAGLIQVKRRRGRFPIATLIVDGTPASVE
jgi:hypothetical protein